MTPKFFPNSTFSESFLQGRAFFGMGEFCGEYFAVKKSGDPSPPPRQTLRGV